MNTYRAHVPRWNLIHLKSTAARGETKRFADLLVKTFAADYAAYCFIVDYATAASVLTAAEKEHQKDMIYLGQANSRPEPVAVQLQAEQVVAILPDFLGGPLPVSEADAVGIVKAAMFKSMDVCNDYMAKIEATIRFVDTDLKDHGITY